MMENTYDFLQNAEEVSCDSVGNSCKLFTTYDHIPSILLGAINRFR